MADPALRWSEADCNDAWTAVARYWNEDPASQGLGFVPAVSHYFNAPEGWDCGKMGSDPCGAGPGSCGDISERGDVDNPAGWMILQSFTTPHNPSGHIRGFTWGKNPGLYTYRGLFTLRVDVCDNRRSKTKTRTVSIQPIPSSCRC